MRYHGIVIDSLAGSSDSWTDQRQTVQALILATGLGSRLGSLTAGTPKCLLEIRGEPIISRLLASFAGCRSTNNPLDADGGLHVGQPSYHGRLDGVWLYHYDVARIFARQFTA